MVAELSRVIFMRLANETAILNLFLAGTTVGRFAILILRITTTYQKADDFNAEIVGLLIRDAIEIEPATFKNP